MHEIFINEVHINFSCDRKITVSSLDSHRHRYKRNMSKIYTIHCIPFSLVYCNVFIMQSSNLFTIHAFSFIQHNNDKWFIFWNRVIRSSNCIWFTNCFIQEREMWAHFLSNKYIKKKEKDRLQMLATLLIGKNMASMLFLLWRQKFKGLMLTCFLG